MSDEKNDRAGVTRLSFIKASAGAAAGAAAVGVPGAALLSKEKAGEATAPSSPNPQEPVMAYVRNAERGEVTVMSGTSEMTYRDHALTRRLLAAAPAQSAESSILNGGTDVLAP